MELGDMKMLHGEMVRLGRGAGVSAVNDGTTEGVAVLDTIGEQTSQDDTLILQVKVLMLAQDLVTRYGEFDGHDTAVLGNYAGFLQQASGVVQSQRELSDKNYTSLLNVASTLAYNVQTMKLEELNRTGYWEARGINTEENVAGEATHLAQTNDSGMEQQ